MITREEIQQIIAEYFIGKPVLRAYLFGSFARNEADDKSDVDVLVEFDHSGEGVDWYMYTDMIDDLSKRFGKKVDIVSTNALSKFIAPYVNQDKLLVYER